MRVSLRIAKNLNIIQIVRVDKVFIVSSTGLNACKSQ